MGDERSTAPGFQDEARRRRAPVWLLLALFVVTLPAVNVRLYASDEVQYFAFLRSLWFDGDVSFENEYRYFYDRGVVRFEGFRLTHLERATATGLRLNFGTLGPAVLWAPFYGLADLAVVAGRSFGSDVPRDGYAWPYLAAVCYGSAVYGFIAILLSARLARRLTGAGLLSAAVIWLGTPLLFYMYLAAGMAHAVSAFAVALMFTVWLKVRERWTVRGVVALGAVGGLVAMVREQDAVLLAGPLYDYARAAVLRLRAHRSTAASHEIRLALSGAAAFAMVYAPQVITYLLLNGRPGPSPLVTRKMTWTSPHAIEVLLSPAHGFFWWTPVAALAVAGLVMLLRRNGLPGAALDAGRSPTIGTALVLSFAGQVYISGCVESWTVAGAYGQRRFVAITSLLVVGLAALWNSVPHGAPRRVLSVVAAAMVWWNLGLMALFGTRMMDRQRLELRRNAYDVFVTIPKAAPGLAFRYLTDRASFYRPPQ
jgi:hypothetical protein